MMRRLLMVGLRGGSKRSLEVTDWVYVLGKGERRGVLIWM